MKEDEELEFNKKNREEYEKLIEQSSTNLDSYWDKNNPIVKIVLFLLFIAILAGIAYGVYMYKNM